MWDQGTVDKGQHLSGEDKLAPRHRPVGGTRVGSAKQKTPTDKGKAQKTTTKKIHNALRKGAISRSSVTAQSGSFDLSSHCVFFLRDTGQSVSTQSGQGGPGENVQQ